jgi:hypothetical protein
LLFVLLSVLRFLYLFCGSNSLREQKEIVISTEAARRAKRNRHLDRSQASSKGKSSSRPKPGVSTAKWRDPRISSSDEPSTS